MVGGGEIIESVRIGRIGLPRGLKLLKRLTVTTLLIQLNAAGIDSFRLPVATVLESADNPYQNSENAT
jgi:hypothetical protein